MVKKFNFSLPQKNFYKEETTMKLKKALSGVLAAAMVVTLAPTMAFATTTNTVSSVPTVASSDNMPAVTLDLEVKDPNGWTTSDVQTIKFNLKNAEWDNNPNKVDSSSGVLKADSTTVISASNATITKLISAADDSVEFEFTPSAALKKGEVVSFTIASNALKSGSENGPVQISIDGLDSKVTSSTLTVANVGSSSTIATVNGSVKSYGRVSNQTVDAKLEIRETAVNSITTDQVVKLTLPKGIAWKQIAIGGNLAENGNAMVTEKKNADLVTAKGEYALANDGRSVYIFLDCTNENAVRQVATLTSTISIDRTASEGDIDVDITSYKAAGNGNSITDASDLVIAKYGNESVEVKTVGESDIPSVYTGFVQTNKDKYNWVQVTLKETVKDSLQSGRFIDFDLPEEVQVVKTEGIRATLDKDAKLKDATDFSKLDTNLIDFDDDKDFSNFSVTVPDNGATVAGNETWKADKANTFTLFIPVTIQADYTGDVKVDIKGAKAGIDDTTLTVAKAVPVVTVEAKTTDVKNGVQKQAVSDIKITENVAGYMNAGTILTVALDNLGLTNALVFDDAKVEVTAGDLEINKTTIKEGVINIPIKEESTKPSTISITGITATLNRTLPEGGYDLKIGESLEKDKSALIDNEKYNDEDFDVAPVTVKGYINIVTPADTNTVKVNASFVIGKTSYTNNGTEVTMDAAPYIAKNRTMVPIRYIANACGVTDENITWNQATRTATISGPNNVVTIKMGSNTITTSNGVITMDTVAVNNGNRIYVPARFIANALGATVTWDAATQTVGITK